MIFYDTQHETTYYAWLKQAIVSAYDVERRALFYVLALSHELRNHIHEVYDFNENSIHPSALTAAFQTSGSSALTKFAFTLYNDFCEEVNHEVDADDLYKIKTHYDKEYDSYDTVYTHENDVHLFFNHPMYMTWHQPFSFLKLFARINRELFPYLYEAINIRFGLVDKL